MKTSWKAVALRGPETALLSLAMAGHSRRSDRTGSSGAQGAQGVTHVLQGHLLPPADAEVRVVDRLGDGVGEAGGLLDRLIGERTADERLLRLLRLDGRHRDGAQPETDLGDHRSLQARAGRDPQDGEI